MNYKNISLALGMLRCGCSFGDTEAATGIPVSSLMFAYEVAKNEPL